MDGKDVGHLIKPAFVVVYRVMCCSFSLFVVLFLGSFLVFSFVLFVIFRSGLTM